MTQSQYAQISDLTSLSITSADGVRFGNPAMNAALQAASSLADSYLVSQFELPLATSPQGWDMSLTLNVCNIAAWLLFNQYGFAPMSPGDELIGKRYEAAIDWLKQIRDKLIFPVWTDSGSNGPTDEAGTFFISDPPIGFTSRGIGSPDTGEYTPSGVSTGRSWWPWGW